MASSVVVTGLALAVDNCSIVDVDRGGLKHAARGLKVALVDMGALFYSSVKCTGTPTYPYKDILVHRSTSPMNKTTQGIICGQQRLT